MKYLQRNRKKKGGVLVSLDITVITWSPGGSFMVHKMAISFPIPVF